MIVKITVEEIVVGCLDAAAEVSVDADTLEFEIDSITLYDSHGIGSDVGPETVSWYDTKAQAEPYVDNYIRQNTDEIYEDADRQLEGLEDAYWDAKIDQARCGD